ncbi:MAG TPA: hypothetical protein VIK55_06695 [Paludibacter sp.]
MTFPSNIGSLTPARYIFKLVCDAKEIICDTEPIEWASGKITIKRDLEVGGVFISSNADSLTFVGNGAELLRILYDIYGLNAKCTLIQYRWKEFDFDVPANGRQYIEFPERYNIDFNFYQTVKVGKFSFGIRVKAINSSIQTKFDQRQDIDVDLNKLVSIGEIPIVDYQSMKKFINYDATNIYNFAELSGSYDFSNALINGLYDFPRVKGGYCFATIPLDIVKNDFNGEILAVPFKNRITNIKNISKLLSNSHYPRTFIFNYNFNFNVASPWGYTPPWDVQLIISDAAELNFSDNVIDLGSFGNDSGSVNISGTETFDIKEGENIRLVVRTGDISGTDAFLMTAKVSFTQEVIASPARKVEGFPIYEAFERICQHIFDTQYPLYSDFFGRTDVKYDKIGSVYSSENQLSFAHIQGGLNLRGMLLSQMSLPVNFKDLLKTAKSIWNLGYGFEVILGTTRLRIEEYAHFFKGGIDDEIILDPPLSSRFNKYDIESQVMIEYAPNDIKSGFDKFEYLQINGLAEPNTTSQRTSILNTATKFENIATYRGDTEGILVSLNTPIDTTDTKQDSDIFITKSQRVNFTIFGITISEWKPERSENIAIENNSSIFRNDLLNRYFTPTRMLIRQANRLKSALAKPFFSKSFLTFQTSNNLQTLETTGEGYDHSIIENANIPVSDLADPIYLPMKHKVTCLFTMKDLEALKANLTGWFDFGLDIKGASVKGYLIEFEMPTGKDEATITIIEKYN